MKNIGEAMYSLNKKKSKLSPAEKHSHKVYHSRNKSKTDNSPNANRSLSKDQIKSTIKNYVNHQNAASKINKVTYIKQEPKKSKKIKSRLQISIPNIRSSLTPKSFKNYEAPRNDRQVHSTKAADNSKMFTNSGRYDLKQLFDNKSPPYLKESGRAPYNSGNKITRQQSRVEDKKFEEATIKFNRDDDFDVRSVLTTEEYEKFGDRFPQKFKRIGLLGRGGFSVVWLGIHKSSKRKIAVKQILTKNPHQTHLKQIWFGSYFFQKGGEARQEFENHIGINNICKLYSHEIRTIDSWLYYELCEESLGACLFDLKGETVNGERSYKIYYKQLIYRMRDSVEELKNLIIQISKALHLINSHNIVHSDLKTQNILLKLKRKDQSSSTPFIKALKLIDFGSSFLFTNLKHFSMATPEYMPPEILNYILFQNKLQYDVLMLNKMEKYKNAWTIDVWSLGCIVLQIVSGVPLWMSLPTKIDESQMRATGLFAVKGRLFNKIIQKQIEVVENIDNHLTKDNYSGIKLDCETKQILKRMLDLNPEKRVSPYEILTYFGVDCEPQRIPFY